MRYLLLVTDRDLRPVGDPIGWWRRLEAVLRYRLPGTGSATVTATPARRAQFARGNRVVLLRDSQPLVAGPIEHIAHERAADGPTITVTWADDLAHIAGRLVYPNPALPAFAQDTARRVITGISAEQAMRTLVDENAGPGALEARQIPRLVLGAPAGVGEDVTVSARFVPLGDAMRNIAIGGGELGFRTRQEADTIVFEVFAPRDLSATVRFATGWGSLRSYRFTQTAPRVSTAIVGGADAGADRTIRELSDLVAVADWGRVEQFVDARDVDDTAELDVAGVEALAEGGETAELAFTAVDTDQIRLFHDYEPGDVVSVSLEPGLDVVDVVRGAHLVIDPAGGETASALVGAESASTDPWLIRESRRLARLLARSGTSGELPTT